MKKKNPEKPYGLCFRCEHRAKFLETSKYGEGDRPRFQCGTIEQSAHSCYMFHPVKPVVTVPLDRTDPRPRLASALVSAREMASVIPECRLRVRRHGRDGAVLYWEPKKEKP